MLFAEPAFNLASDWALIRDEDTDDRIQFAFNSDVSGRITLALPNVDGGELIAKDANGYLGQNLIPDTRGIYALGENGREWEDLWIGNAAGTVRLFIDTTTNPRISSSTGIIDFIDADFLNCGDITQHIAGHTITISNAIFATQLDAGDIRITGSTISNSGVGAVLFGDDLDMSAKDIIDTGHILPDADNTRDLGTVGGTDYRFRHLYLSGNLSDEANSLTIANAKTAYDHSQDNSQAHSDYLINNGNDATTGTVTMAGLTLSQSTSIITYGDAGAQDILDIIGNGVGTNLFRIKNAAGTALMALNLSAATAAWSTTENLSFGSDGNMSFSAVTAAKKITFTSPQIFFDNTVYILERSSDPTEPAEGQCVIWMSDGTGKGDDGDVMVASKAGGTTNYGTLFDHSGGAGW